MSTGARLTHITPNGLGNAPASRPAPDFLQAARLRREVIANSVTFFEQDGDHAAADAARAALAAQDEIIANLQAADRRATPKLPKWVTQSKPSMNQRLREMEANVARRSQGVCPVCGRPAGHDWQACAEADAQEDRTARADQAEILDWIRG